MADGSTSKSRSNPIASGVGVPRSTTFGGVLGDLFDGWNPTVFFSFGTNGVKVLIYDIRIYVHIMCILYIYVITYNHDTFSSLIKNQVSCSHTIV